MTSDRMVNEKEKHWERSIFEAKKDRGYERENYRMLIADVYRHLKAQCLLENNIRVALKAHDDPEARFTDQ